MQTFKGAAFYELQRRTFTRLIKLGAVNERPRISTKKSAKSLI